MALVDFERAKKHLRVETVDQDDDINTKLEQASALVVTHMKAQAIAGWSDGTVAVPGAVEAATLVLLTHLYENRGDDMTASPDVWQAVERLLVTLRDPALA